MSKDKLITLAALLLLFVAPAFAWNCPNGQIRQQAPAGTPTNTPYYDVVEGIAFICVPNSITPPTLSGTQNQSQTQNQANSQQQSQNNSQNSTQNTTNQNSSSSGSSSKSNSNVSNSGNSKNSNSNVNNVSPILNSTNNATGGSATASNNSSGNQTDISSTYNESKIPVNTAYAAAPYPTAQCFKGGGIGGQAGMFGFTANGGRIDENCAILETARSFDAVNERLAACKVKINNKYAKKAGVTLTDCMNVPIIASVPIVPLQATPVTPNITVNLPAPVVNVTPTPVVIDHTPAYVPQPVYKAPVVKKKKPIGTMRPCPNTPSNNAKANCYEDD